MATRLAIAANGELLAWIGATAPGIRLALAEHFETRRALLAAASAEVNFR